MEVEGRGIGQSSRSGRDTHVGAELGAAAAQGARAVVKDDTVGGLHMEVARGVDEDEFVVQHPVHVLQLDVGALASLLWTHRAGVHAHTHICTFAHTPAHTHTHTHKECTQI